MPTAASAVAAAAAPPPAVPEAAAATTEEPAAADGGSRFAVQVGAFLYEENSSRMVEQLLELGYDPYVVKKTASGDRVFETVRFGHYPSRQQASLAATEFMEREGFEAAIVRERGTL